VSAFTERLDEMLIYFSCGELMADGMALSGLL
jgi:hypothetical protein